MKLLDLTLNYRLNLIKKSLDLPLKGDVLDVGCGTGEISKELSKNITVADIYNYLKVDNCSKVDLINPMKFVRILNNCKLPFKDKSFDYVTFIDTLHHIRENDQWDYIDEAVRIAKKEVILFEAKPSFYSYFVDLILNKIRYGYNFKVPLCFRQIDDWSNYNVEIVDVPFWYPFKHYIVRIKSNG